MRNALGLATVLAGTLVLSCNSNPSPNPTPGPWTPTPEPQPTSEPLGDRIPSGNYAGEYFCESGSFNFSYRDTISIGNSGLPVYRGVEARVGSWTDAILDGPPVEVKIDRVNEMNRRYEIHAEGTFRDSANTEYEVGVTKTCVDQIDHIYCETWTSFNVQGGNSGMIACEGEFD